MFDYIRTHIKAIQWLLIILILPGFVLFGIEGFRSIGEKSETVAVIDGRAVGQMEWDAAIRNDVDRIRQNAPNMDPKSFDTPEFKYASLEQLVRRKVLAAAAQTLNLGVSDQRLAQELLQNPMLAALRLSNGKINELKYKELLEPQDMTPKSFEARVRSDLSAQQVLQGLAMSGMLPDSVADVALKAYFERREIQILKFSPTDFLKSIAPTMAEVETFYKANAPLFQATEKASIQYVTLDLESIKKTILPSDADIKIYYENYGDKFSAAEERKASHILIAVAKSASASERLKAKTQAELLLADIKKNTANFSALAKKNSQDPVSAKSGGDLGFFTRGSMVKPFEDAVFSMKPGQISDVVESDFGFHIIQLSEIKVSKKRSLTEMKPVIEQELKKQLAQKQFSEAAEIFTNTAYEQSDSLKPVADKLKIDIQTAHNVTQQVAPGAHGALANSKFLAALFSPDAIDKKRNSQAVEIGGNQLVAGRIVNYAAAQILPFESVKDSAREFLINRLSQELARTQGMAKLAELTSESSGNAIATDPMSAPVTVSRDAMQQQNPKLIEAVMRANSSKLPLWLGIDIGTEGYALVRLNKIADYAMTLVEKNRAKYFQVWSSAEGTSYYEYLKKKLNVKIKISKPVAKEV